MAQTIMQKAPSIRKNLCELKSLLVEDNGRAIHRIRFRRKGNTYQVQANDDRLRSKLEESFNNFMSKLDVKEDGSKIKGLLFIDKETDAFSLGYQKEGEPVLHQIKGRLG